MNKHSFDARRLGFTQAPFLCHVLAQRSPSLTVVHLSSPQ